MQGIASSKKKGYSYLDDTTYVPSAEKNDFQDITQTYIERTPDRKEYTSSKKAISHFSEAQRSIDDVIEMVSQKKRLNEEAI